MATKTLTTAEKLEKAKKDLSKERERVYKLERKQILEDQATEAAEGFMILKNACLEAGFSEQEALEIVLTMIKNQAK